MYVNRSISSSNGGTTCGGRGFTLVEMLVSTALVVLIMTLFAQIYSGAIGSITEQRGMGNNDQKARILTTLMHGDLANTSYKQVDKSKGSDGGIVPLIRGDAGTTGDAGILDTTNQQGYFYISENDPLNSSDDVLQFTTRISDTTARDNYYIGRATDLGVDSQPYSDRSIQAGVVASKYAEVCYFLRKGTLYRRVLMLRDMSSTEADEQPLNKSTGDHRFRNIGMEDYSGNSFWNDFDFSATRIFNDPTDAAAPTGKTSLLWFHGLNSLGNQSAGTDNLPLGLPWNRFGFQNDQRTTGNVNHGQPREFLNSNPPSSDPDNVFIGRYTQMETSDPDMSFPGVENAASYQFFHRGNPGGQSYDNTNGGLSGLTDGNRFGEDILLTNVEAFDIEVWEPSTGEYVQLGNSGTGHFSQSNNQNSTYGPLTAGNNIFDTWHPEASVAGNASPPYRPVLDNSPLVDWAPSTTYSVGQKVRIPGLDGGGGVFSNSLYYEVILANGSSAVGATGQSNSTTGGGPTNLSPGTLYSDNGNELTWKCIDNRIGLRGIRITIRYIDLNSRLPRQVTVVHSFCK